jgi:chromosome partitioning protein
MSPNRAHHIVFANEKGGTGKSTTAVHIAIALAAQGYKVAALDLDVRQKTLARYLDNRAATMRRRKIELPTVRHGVLDLMTPAGVQQESARLGFGHDFVIIDTPGKDDPVARAAIALADTIVTPINDSFIDLDLIGQVDAETYRVKKPSFYAELIWDLRKERAKEDGTTVDWVVLRNRLQQIQARNMTRVGNAVNDLAKRVGYRPIPGLSERVIYRELFPAGLTLLDIDAVDGVSIGHIAARQELRELIGGLELPIGEQPQGKLALG